MKKCLYCNKLMYLKTDPYVREYRKSKYQQAFYCRRCNKCFVNVETQDSREIRILYYSICLMLSILFFIFCELNTGEKLFICLSFIFVSFGISDVLHLIYTGCMVECDCDNNYQPIINKSNYIMNVSNIKKVRSIPTGRFNARLKIDTELIPILVNDIEFAPDLIKVHFYISDDLTVTSEQLTSGNSIILYGKKELFEGVVSKNDSDDISE